MPIMESQHLVTTWSRLFQGKLIFRDVLKCSTSDKFAPSGHCWSNFEDLPMFTSW